MFNFFKKKFKIPSSLFKMELYRIQYKNDTINKNDILFFLRSSAEKEKQKVIKMGCIKKKLKVVTVHVNDPKYIGIHPKLGPIYSI